jgi:hypothetical protein
VVGDEVVVDTALADVRAVRGAHHPVLDRQPVDGDGFEDVVHQAAR